MRMSFIILFMNSWKIVLKHHGKIVEFIVVAISHADARIKTEQEYSGCKIIRIINLESGYAD
jgi:hypothetical protein